MTGVEVLTILNGALRLAGVAGDIYSRMTDEGRSEVTPEEIAALKAHQKTAEENWQAQLERLRKEQGTD